LWRLGLLIVTASCGRLGFDPLVDVTGDGGTGDGVLGDGALGDGAGQDAFVLPHATPFAAPQLITGLNSPADDDLDPSLTQDELDLYFASDRAGNVDIWRSTRANATLPWPAPQRVVELATAQLDQSPELSPDGLELWFSSDRAGSTGADIYVTTRATRTTAWSAPTRVTELASAANDHSPTLSADRLTILFDSTRNGSVHVFQATRPSIGAAWSTPVQLAELDLPSFTMIDPFVSDDGLTVFFGAGPGSPIDLYSTSRSSLTSPFDAPQVHTELRARANNTDAWVSADRRRIVFSAWGGTQFDLFVAAR
jgi:hypothetical protein